MRASLNLRSLKDVIANAFSFSKLANELKKNIGNRQRSGQDKEIYGEVLAFEGRDNTINAGEAGEQNNRQGRYY